MPKRVLIAYATRMGSTREVADQIAAALRDVRTTVEVAPVELVTSMATYDAVIVGSPIRDGAWLPEAVHFVSQHRELLSRKPTAYFMTCRTMRGGAPEQQVQVMRYLEPMWATVPEVAPRAVGCFGGKLDLRDHPWWLRLMMRLNRTPTGDWRDWHAVREWADSLRSGLVG